MAPIAPAFEIDEGSKQGKNAHLHGGYSIAERTHRL
jgi:hypothetical protein